ncbi:MAG: YwbE family protein [Desulfobacula sp.]|nr:YwbE family protein [Desulfobacula sp.]
MVLKKDQRTGILTEGIVKTLLTKSPSHPHGIKVRLENDLVGRVKIIHN